MCDVLVEREPRPPRVGREWSHDFSLTVIFRRERRVHFLILRVDQDAARKYDDSELRA